MGRFFLTTPIYYVNAPVHLGHAYTSIACDVLARWRRLRGDDVFFLTGLDEHGGNIEKVAKEAGVEPQAWCDRIAGEDRAFFDELKITYDDFIRTTEERHAKATEAFWKAVAAAKTPKGREAIYKGEYAGLYCPPCEAYYVEEQLVDGKCPVHHLPVEALKEESYFFRLSDYQDFLAAYFQEHPGFITPETRFNEVKGFIKEGLRDISITRTKIRWGFPVPGDSKHVIYVWFDALINYLTALGYPDATAARWPYWTEGRVTHVMAKEIIRFHCLLWPAMLQAAGIRIMDRVAVHGYWTVNGAKMSKTTGNVIDPLAYARQYGLDAVRHYLLAEIGFGVDGDFSERRFVERYNTDLANVFGNLAHRTIAMAQKYSGGKLKRPATASPWPAAVADRAVAIMDEALAVPQFQAALDGLWELAKSGNKYIDERAPWNQPEAEREETLGHVVILLEALSWPLLAFMPDTAAKLRERLGLPAAARVPLPDVFTLTAGDPLFPRIDTKAKKSA